MAGGAEVIDLGGIPETQPHGYSAMYGRLVDYGLCWLRGTGKAERIAHADVIRLKGEDDRIVMTTYTDPDPDRKPRVWSMRDIEAAGRLHSTVIRLPMAHNLCIQVFFNETCAENWDKIVERDREQILRDLTLWPSRPFGLNARIRRANAACGTHIQPIHPTHFLPLLEDAILMLRNRERALNVGRKQRDSATSCENPLTFMAGSL